MTCINHYNNLCFVTLQCPTNSASGSVDYYCQSQETAIKEAKEEIKKLESSSTDDSKKQIAEQNAKIKKAEDAKNDCAKTHHLPQEEREKGLDEVKQQREIVDKLKKFATELGNNSNNNILTHLCDGLQKFLGYDKDSKGYTGDGIVYSDLDRLCDAVMGFLSGVLKDVSEKQPYSVGKNTLNSVSNLINNHLYSGHEGFKKLFAELPAGIERYNRDVQEGNERVKRPIDTLLKQVNEDFKKQVSEILSDNVAAVDANKIKKAVESVDIKLHTAINCVAAFTTAMRDAKFYVDDVNCELKTSLNHTIHAMRREIHLLHLRQEEGSRLTTLVEKVYWELDRLNIDLNKETKSQVETLVNTIRDELGKRKKQIEDMKQPLHQWITETYKELNSALADVSENVETFTKQYGIINQQFGKIKQIVEPLVLDAPVRITLPRSAIEVSWSGVKDRLEHLSQAIIGDLEEFKNTIKTPIREYIASLRGGAIMADNVTEGVNSVMDALIKALDTKANEKTGVINVFNNVRINLNEIMTKYDEVMGNIQPVVKELTEQIESISTQFKQTNSPDTLLQPLIINFPEDMKKLSSSIDALIQVVHTADQALTTWIEQVEAYLNTIDKTRDKYVHGIEKYVDGCVSYAKEVIISDIRKRYVSSVKALLTAFADKVEKELAELPGEIDEDLRIGFKGLMRVMGGVSSVTGKPVGGSGTPGINSESLLEKIKKVAESHSPGTAMKDTFTKLSEAFDNYFTPIHDYINIQINSGNASETEANQKITATNIEHLDAVNSKFTDLLEHLNSVVSQPRTYIFDHTFTKRHDSLSTSLASLSPSAFANPRHPELLDAVKKGLQGFVTEMGRVYVNKYEGAEYVEWDDKTSNDGQNCAKIFLSLIPDWFDHLNWLLLECNGGRCTDDQIYINDNDKATGGTRLGIWFRQRGYKVSRGAKNQDGELRSNDKFKGGQIKDILAGRDKHVYSTENLNSPNLLNRLLGHLQNYRKVCHLEYTPKAKPPTTVYQMLLWLTGLYWNNMYGKVNAYIPTWYGELTAEYDLGGKPLEVAMPESGGFCTIQKVDAKNLQQLLNNVTIRPYQILVALCGHGHSEGRYACDFFTNADKLLYPSRDSDCFDMFIDICMRLNQQLRFLYTQCTNYMEQSGWRDCHYGKGIAGSSWNCNSLQCPNQIGDQSHKQKCDQQCDQTPKCGMKSPLQSFLEDGLQGFLPHQFTSPGCKLTCSARDHAGKTCLTPMGFADIGIAASHTKTGEHLTSLLAEFCGPLSKQMTMFCAYVTCLQRRPPQTLGDMFSFYHNFLGNWKGQGSKHKYDAFNGAVQKAYFGVEYSGFRPETIQLSKVHQPSDTGKKSSHAQGDLFSLLNCDPDQDANLPCGQYLQPLTLSALSLFTDKHANLYLSWIMYMTETFYDLLAQLWNQCCRDCDKPGSRCHDRRCSKKCPVKYADTDGNPVTPSNGDKHDTDCNSIVKCQSTHPTLYRYGFTFGSPCRLSGAKNYDQQKRTCKDFCEALERVLAKDSLLVELIRSIDEFLWKIREYFTYTVVALWSASFLYLLYVYIGRLDTLHIRSHLRTPASHKITAQSLLAAARIGKLAKISYLQP